MATAGGAVAMKEDLQATVGGAPVAAAAPPGIAAAAAVEAAVAAAVAAAPPGIAAAVVLAMLGMRCCSSSRGISEESPRTSPPSERDTPTPPRSHTPTAATHPHISAPEMQDILFVLEFVLACAQICNKSFSRLHTS